MLWDKLIATFVWETRFGRGDVPVFEFIGERADDYAVRQHNERERAISDACLTNHIEPAERKAVDLDIMTAMLRDGTRSARLFGSGVRGAEPAFFVHKREVYFDASGWVYKWDHEIGGWLLWVEGERKAA
jgi:hypothetical protein